MTCYELAVFSCAGHYHELANENSHDTVGSSYGQITLTSRTLLSAD